MAQLSNEDFYKKWVPLLADNVFQEIDGSRLEQLLADMRDSLGGAGGVFKLKPTESLGGIVAGKDYNLTAEGYLRALLEKYQAPGFTAFTFDDQGSRTVPVGTAFGAGNKVFTWATSNSALVKGNSLALLDVTGKRTLASNEANDGKLTTALPAFTAVLGESRHFRLSATNSQGDVFTADLVIAGETESYLGASTAASLDGAQLVALGGAQLQGSRARTAAGITTSGGQYLYYAYDARHGDLSGIVLDGAAPVLGAFRKLGDVPSTNATGAAVLLRVYRSNAPNAFASNSLDFK